MLYFVTTLSINEDITKEFPNDKLSAERYFAKEILKAENSHKNYTIMLEDLSDILKTVQIENEKTNINDKPEGNMQIQDTITESDIASKANIFKSTEQQVHNRINETEMVVVENINNLEYFKGYAKGMNGLIDKVQATASLQIVIAEVQMLTNQYNLIAKLNDYSPSYPNNHENPLFLKGQIKGITEGVQTLRNIDITKYIENAPQQEQQATPNYPALSSNEKEQHTDFVNVMQKNYPTADINTLNKLCSVAHDLKKIQLNAANFTYDAYETQTENKHLELKKLISDFPGLKVSIPYKENEGAIKFVLPQGQINTPEGPNAGYFIPEISANKLIPQKATGFTIASPINSNVAKSQSR